MQMIVSVKVESFAVQCRILGSLFVGDIIAFNIFIVRRFLFKLIVFLIVVDL